MKHLKKINSLFFIMSFIAMNFIVSNAQNIVHPKTIKKSIKFAISGPIRNNPIVKNINFQQKIMPIQRKINPKINLPEFNTLTTNKNIQSQAGTVESNIKKNFAGQNSSLYPPDANGDVNDAYYFQVVNNTYAIYDKNDGSIVAGPSNLNSIFDSSLPGAQFNNGDPIVLWDEHAQRWFFTEFSLGTPLIIPKMIIC